MSEDRNSNGVGQTPAKVNLERIRAYGTILVSVFGLTSFLVALIWSFVTNDEGMKNLTAGASVAMATTTVGYWLGSSKGSEKKDDVIAASMPPDSSRIN